MTDDDATLSLGEPARSHPDRVGPYRLLRELGEGGMGRVFLAEQETPDFRRTVAIKLIDRPGASTQSIARFRDEVRILASLDHPGIVRFLDGGLSSEGVWFLALEYVEGDDLVAHARRLELGVAARVELVAAVAEAVQFAHERGVIHRDIKPANVLVARDGRPRLLDFGISKLLDREEAAGLATTRHGAHPLTPAYASPEQLAGESATPASDIYSLGVLLYELLAGARPATVPTEPEPPSRAARRSGPRTGRSAGRRIRRDLDAICLKALRRAPVERYATAGRFAVDLRRHLAGEPVEARPRRSRWRLERVRRWPVVSATVAALLLLGVAGLVVRGAFRDRANAPKVTASPKSSLFPFDPINPPPVEESEKRFAEAPDNLVVGAELAIRLAREERSDEAWIVLGRLRQIPGAEEDPLVDYAAASVASSSEEFQRALVFLTRAKETAIARGRTELLGTIRAARGNTLDRLGHRDAAFAELGQARLELERAGDKKPLYRVLVTLAALHYERGEVDRCEAMYSQAVRAAESDGFEPLVALTGLAEVNLLRGRPDLAEPLARGPLASFRKYPSPARPADALTRLAQIVRDLGRSAEAEELLDEAIALVSASKGPGALADALLVRSRFDFESGRLDRIDAIVKELESLAIGDLSRRTLAFARTVTAQRSAFAGDLAAARSAFAEARRIYLAEGYRDYAALSDLEQAEAEARSGDGAAAARVLDQALTGFDEASSILPRYFAETLRARIDAAAGRTAAARDRLAALGPDAAESPSVGRRIAFLRAQAAVAAAEHQAAAARRGLSAALDLARQGGRKVAELEIRTELATLAGAGPDRAALEAVRREAETLGLGALANRARASAVRAPARGGSA
jgi:serine/threonine protein kinase